MSIESEVSLPEPAGEYAQIVFADALPKRPYTILNMVSSADGKAAVDGSESALSSPRDKLVLQSLRVHADAILNGMGTARATGVNPSIRDARLRALRQRGGRAKPPLQALFTRGGSISPAAAYWRGEAFERVLFVAAKSEPLGVNAVRNLGTSIELVPEGMDGVATMLEVLLSKYGVRLLLVEGGPGLNASLFRAQAIDEFFLTLSPHIVGGRATITPVEGDPFEPGTIPGLQLVSARPVPETSEVYLRWQVTYDRS